jgi:hypothetical protein
MQRKQEAKTIYLSIYQTPYHGERRQHGRLPCDGIMPVTAFLC